MYKVKSEDAWGPKYNQSELALSVRFADTMHKQINVIYCKLF